MKTQRVAHLLCHLLVLFPAASFAPSRGPRPSTCLRKKGGVEFEDFSSVGTVPAAARELSGALAEEQRDMAVISPLVNALPQWANVPPGEDVRFALLRGDWKLSFVRNVDTFSIVGTGSGGPFVFVSLGLGGQLVQKQDFRPLSAGREVINCLVNIKWNTPRRTRVAAQ